MGEACVRLIACVDGIDQSKVTRLMEYDVRGCQVAKSTDNPDSRCNPSSLSLSPPPRKQMAPFRGKNPKEASTKFGEVPTPLARIRRSQQTNNLVSTTGLHGHTVDNPSMLESAIALFPTSNPPVQDRASPGPGPDPTHIKPLIPVTIPRNPGAVKEEEEPFSFVFHDCHKLVNFRPTSHMRIGWSMTHAVAAMYQRLSEGRQAWSSMHLAAPRWLVGRFDPGKISSTVVDRVVNENK
ncbi:hypothetical protein FFLO_00718 [Filobasidium floriforme]|uniref:Uncharacterized protein n=1 Tax=Filobasidium floriforme TaxID=5210 RepID=A0A8K0JRD7_9TREE|nr:uncharacterized protein HD553DRAFT_334807 [Filobasidium floriforme]KAG7571366.1 hypothetical protein FFLO_00718 [Filobasidium floriforme]KAH8086320.1 hypothetical protein HD553DRAFT_334807 [Filobasidium floriforme]